MTTMTEKATEIAHKVDNPKLAPFAYMLLAKKYDEEIIEVFFDYWDCFLPADEWKDEYTAVYDNDQVFNLYDITTHMEVFCKNGELEEVVDTIQERVYRLRGWLK